MHELKMTQGGANANKSNGTRSSDGLTTPPIEVREESGAAESCDVVVMRTAGLSRSEEVVRNTDAARNDFQTSRIPVGSSDSSENQSVAEEDLDDVVITSDNEDAGPGVAEQQLPNLLADAVDKNRDGSGVLAKKNHNEIEAETSDGNGSTGEVQDKRLDDLLERKRSSVLHTALESRRPSVRPFLVLGFVVLFGSVWGIVYSTLRNSFPCEHPDLGRAVPHPLWSAVFEGVWLGALVPAAMLAKVRTYGPVDLCWLLSDSAICTVIYAAFLVCGNLRALVVNKNPEQLLDSRLLCAPILVVLFSLTCVNVVRRHAKRDGGNPWAFGRRHLRFIRGSSMFAFIFFIGFYGAVVFATRLFPGIQRKMADLVEDEEEPRRTVLIALGELSVSTIFFSAYLPIWGKFLAKMCSSVVSVYRPDGVRDELLIGSSRLSTDFVMDLTRYVYGRGVLFAVSNMAVFCLIVAKDIVHEFWHYLLKNSEGYIVFVLKIFHPATRDSFQRMWFVVVRMVRRYVEVSEFFFESVQIAWTSVVDYRDHLLERSMSGILFTPGSDDRAGMPTTSVSISLSSGNMSCKIVNIPNVFGERMLKEPQGMCDATDRVSQLSIESSAPCESMPSKDSMFSTHGLFSASEGNQQKFRLPVREVEIDSLLGIICVFQKSVCSRYQIRAAAKLFTSLMFLVCPLIGGFSQTRHFPGFATPVHDARLFACGIIFLCTDIFEWMVITRGMLYQGQGLRGQMVVMETDGLSPPKHLDSADQRRLNPLENLDLLLKRDGSIALMCLYSALLGIFMFGAFWNPWDLPTLKQHLVEEGLLESTEGFRWEDVYEKCGWN